MSDDEQGGRLIRYQDHRGLRDEGGLYTGRGQTVYENKDQYVGEFCQGKREGTGTYRWAFLNAKYRGGYRDGRKHGRGRMEYTNGCVYEGEFVDGVREGMGRMEFPNLDVYEGEFRGGLPCGRGVYRYFGCGVSVEAEFEAGRPVRGIVVTPCRRLETSFTRGAPVGPGRYIVAGLQQDGEHVDAAACGAADGAGVAGAGTTADEASDAEASVAAEAAEDGERLARLREAEARERAVEGGDGGGEDEGDGETAGPVDPRETELRGIGPPTGYTRRTRVAAAARICGPAPRPQWCPTALPVPVGAGPIPAGAGAGAPGE